MVDVYGGYLNDRKRFEQLGIIEDTVFRIEELNGYYVLDLEKGIIYETTKTGIKIEPVNGLYHSLLIGVWHKKRW